MLPFNGKYDNIFQQKPLVTKALCILILYMNFFLNISIHTGMRLNDYNKNIIIIEDRMRQCKSKKMT